MFVAFEKSEIPAPWLIFALAVTLVAPVFAAYAAAWHRLSPTTVAVRELFVEAARVEETVMFDPFV